MAYLVANPEDRFPRGEARMQSLGMTSELLLVQCVEAALRVYEMTEVTLHIDNLCD